ncbi:hypothetical protein [Mycoplasmopsis cricetuli]|uniref:hypothetical protein n=1 Tax=Mycoplasmopsis cricetuli TaxID=171283 RepID=UPI000471D6D5|nr:hypothetical protein [Mycoplasmopsis cricetuli]
MILKIWKKILAKIKKRKKPNSTEKNFITNNVIDILLNYKKQQIQLINENLDQQNLFKSKIYKLNSEDENFFKNKILSKNPNFINTEKLNLLDKNNRKFKGVYLIEVGLYHYVGITNQKKELVTALLNTN